jgi:predicted RNase H-like nuclease (RuvC/YqgF family)
MITPEVRIGRMQKKIDRLKAQRDSIKKDLEHYQQVISMQPHLKRRFEAYSEMVAERQRVKDLENRVKEQAELIRLLQKKTCHCYNCADPMTRLTTMIVCPKCGNKRCPHATNHSIACTDSNAPEQEGSRY